MNQDAKDILNSLDILLDDLTDEQKRKLGKIGDMVRNPNNMSPNEAIKIVKELGIDIEGLQKKARRLRAESSKGRKVRIPRNDPCPCNSGKKYKKCCINKNE